MTLRYVRSGATGAGTGVDWANAFTTLTTAMASTVAGDTVFVSEDHAESTAGAVTIAVPSSLGTPTFIYCVNHAGSVPPVSADLRTTATVTTTGASALTINGSNFYVYGITFNGGSSGSPGVNIGTTASSYTHFINCNFVANSGGTQVTTIGGASSRTVLENCTYKVTAIGSTLAIGGNVVDWINTSSAIQGATIPTTLLGTTATGIVTFRGVDLSALGSNALTGSTATTGFEIFFIDCKLGSGAVINTPSGPGRRYELIRADSGATNYRDERYWYTGTQTVETTIVRTGGATDGTTPISWKIVTTANSEWILPFETQPITIWNDTTGSSIAVTVFGIWGGASVPNNDDIWIEVEYLGSASTPLGSFTTTTKSDGLATGTAVSTDTSTWGGSTTPFKLTTNITPQMKGPVNITVKAAKVSSTFYIDPKPQVDSITVSKSLVVMPGVYTNQLSTGSGVPASRIWTGM